MRQKEFLSKCSNKKWLGVTKRRGLGGWGQWLKDPTALDLTIRSIEPEVDSGFAPGESASDSRFSILDVLSGNLSVLTSISVTMATRSTWLVLAPAIVCCVEVV